MVSFLEGDYCTRTSTSVSRAVSANDLTVVVVCVCWSVLYIIFVTLVNGTLFARVRGGNRRSTPSFNRSDPVRSELPSEVKDNTRRVIFVIFDLFCLLWMF